MEKFNVVEYLSRQTSSLSRLRAHRHFLHWRWALGRFTSTNVQITSVEIKINILYSVYESSNVNSIVTRRITAFQIVRR